MDSEHIHLIHANNHFNAGKNVKPEELPLDWMRKARSKGALFGRHELASLYVENESDPESPPTLIESQLFLKPEKDTDRYKYEYKLACDKPFSWANMLVNGTLMGAVQVGVLYALNQISPHLPYIGGHMEPLNPYLLAFTFAYSHYAGGWLYPKLRAASQRLTYMSRFWLRGLTISLPYALVYKAFVTQSQMHDAILAGLGPLVAFFVAQGVNIGVNFYINNRVSNELNEHTQLDQELRSHQGYVTGGGMGDSTEKEGWLVKLGLKVKRIDFVGQIRYVFVSFTSRTVDLNDNFKGFHIPLPYLGADYLLSAGKILYLGLAPLLRFSVYKRAERNNTASAPQYRERWEKTLTAKTMKFLGGAPKRLCQAALKNLSSKVKTGPKGPVDDFSDFLF